MDVGAATLEAVDEDGQREESVGIRRRVVVRDRVGDARRRRLCRGSTRFPVAAAEMLRSPRPRPADWRSSTGCRRSAAVQAPPPKPIQVVEQPERTAANVVTSTVDAALGPEFSTPRWCRGHRSSRCRNRRAVGLATSAVGVESTVSMSVAELLAGFGSAYRPVPSRWWCRRMTAGAAADAADSGVGGRWRQPAGLTLSLMFVTNGPAVQLPPLAPMQARRAGEDRRKSVCHHRALTGDDGVGHAAARLHAADTVALGDGQVGLDDLVGADVRRGRRTGSPSKSTVTAAMAVPAFNTGLAVCR